MSSPQTVRKEDYLGRFPAPAKLNLFLRILGRDSSGYHQLQTLFQFLDYSDMLYFRFRGDSQIVVSPAIDNLAPQQNLIWKAADRLRNRAHQDGVGQVEQGLDIHVEKKLPIGGGIGGGSSNAATCLLVLNRLWKCNYSDIQLAELALDLGADVPVFVGGFSAWAEGRGERLQRMEIAEPWYLVIQPKCHVSTAEIFRHRELTRDSSPITIRAFLNGAPLDFTSATVKKPDEIRTVEGLIKRYVQVGNDCQSLVTKLYPEVAHALNSLNHFSQAQLTGTGACVFAAFENRQKAEQALAGLRDVSAYRQVFIAKACNRSPLHQALAEYF